MSNLLPESPNAAVQAWWQAMQNQDLAALQQLTAEDYLASGGPAGRTTTRDQLLAEAKTFFEETTRIDTWSVEAMSCLDLGTVAVCAYDWAEHGQHAGQAFDLAGTATDVLVRRGAGWVHQAHHVTLQHPQAMS
jgi:ketosteroid isomerase-like protein